MVYNLAIGFCFLILKIFFGFKVYGRHNVPKTGPFILACNHESNLDPIVASVACPRKVFFLAKEELFRNKLAAFFLHLLHARPLRRGGLDTAALRGALEILKDRPILLFPQGTRGGDLEHAKEGVGFLCKKARVPVVVAKIKGTDKILPKGKITPNPGKISIIFDMVEDINFDAGRDEITAKIVDKIHHI